MSESLFVLCTVSCLYLVRTGRIRTGGLLGAYAAFTRSPGLILVVPILFELVRSRAKAREYIALFMVPLGFAAYCMVNYSVSGDAFKFMEYQSIHWHQQLGWFSAPPHTRRKTPYRRRQKARRFYGDCGCRTFWRSFCRLR